MRAVVTIILLAFCASAQAYIGPGAGLSVLGSLWAVLVAIALALFAVLTWPLRLLWRKLRGRRASPSQARDADGNDAAP